MTGLLDVSKASVFGSLQRLTVFGFLETSGGRGSFTDEKN